MQLVSNICNNRVIHVGCVNCNCFGICVSISFSWLKLNFSGISFDRNLLPKLCWQIVLSPKSSFVKWLPCLTKNG